MTIVIHTLIMTAEDQFMCIGVSFLAALGATLAMFAISKSVPVIYEKMKSTKDSIMKQFEKQKDKDLSLQSIPDSKDSFEVNVVPVDCNEMEFFQIMTPVYIAMPLAPTKKLGNLQALPKEEKKWKLKESLVNLKASSEVSNLEDRNEKTKNSKVTVGYSWATHARNKTSSSKPDIDTSSSDSDKSDIEKNKEVRNLKVEPKVGYSWATHARNKTSSSKPDIDTSSSDSDKSDIEKNKEVRNLKVEPKVSSAEDKNRKAKKSKPLLKGLNSEESSESESERVVRYKSKSTKSKTTKLTSMKTSDDITKAEEPKSKTSKPSKKAKQSKKRKPLVTKNVRLAGKSGSKSRRKGNQFRKEKTSLKKSSQAVNDEISREAVSEPVGENKSKLSNKASKNLKSVQFQDNSSSNTKDSKVELKANIMKDANDSVHKDVETIVTVEKHPGNENILDIDLDMLVDPKTKKSMKLHTHAVVDKQKMNLHGKAEAKEGEGKAQVSGFISHKGTSDIGTMELDVIEDSQDSDEIEIEAKVVKEEKNDMN